MRRNFIFIIINLIFLFSCGKATFNTILLPPNDNTSYYQPKTIAVLPFQDNINNSEITNLVRISFYSHLAVRGFKDVELTKVDKILKELNIENISSYKKYSKKIAQCLKADFLVFGCVTANQKIFAGVYSLNSIEINIQILDSNSGKIVWSDSVISKSHEGGIPTSIISVPFISLSTTNNITKDSTFILIENACRILAYNIPSKLIPKKLSFNKYYLQAGAFLLKDKAIAYLNTLRKKSLSSLLKEEKPWYKVFVGPFNSLEEVQTQKEILEKKFKIKTLIKKMPKAGLEPARPEGTTPSR